MRSPLQVLILATTAALAMEAAVAQEFPSSPVRFLVPLPAGGTMDIIARTLGAPVSRALGQNVIVDNRPGGGGGGIIGTEVAARAPADGYTVLFIGNGFIVNVPYQGGTPAMTAVIGGHTSILNQGAESQGRVASLI